MYLVKYYTTHKLRSKTFETLHDATMFAVHKVKTGDVYSIDLIKQITPKGLDKPFFNCYNKHMTHPYEDFANSMTPEEARAFLRKVMGPPIKTLEGKERNGVVLLLAMIEPFKTTNNQHSYTEYYMIGETEYHVTTFPDAEVIVDEILKE